MPVVGLAVTVLAEQRAIARQGDARRLQLRLVAHARALGLRERLLVGPRIDAREQLVFLDHLPLGIEHLCQHAADLRPQRDGRQRRDGAQRVDEDRQVGAPRLGMADRRAHAAEGARVARRLVGALDQEPGRAAQAQDHQQRQQAAEPAPPARGGLVFRRVDGGGLGGGKRHRGGGIDRCPVVDL